MRSAAWIGSGLLAFAAVSAGFGFPAQAAVIVGHYYENYTVTSCPTGSNGCDLTFQAIPAGQSVLITHVACQITASPGAPNFVTLGIKNSAGGIIQRADNLPVIANPSSPPYGLWYTAVGETLFLYEPGQFPWVRIQVTPQSSISIACRIAGQRPSPF